MTTDEKIARLTEIVRSLLHAANLSIKRKEYLLKSLEKIEEDCNGRQL